jgi:hypothetical protein
MNATEKFDYAVADSTLCDDHMNLRQKVWFHNFNVNGLVAEKRMLDNLVSALVDEGKALSGAMMAHGTFDSFHEDSVRKLSQKKRVSRIEVEVSIEGLKERNARAAMYLSAFGGKYNTLA